MIRDCLREKDYDWLLEKDYEIYPTDRPVTKKIIQQWYTRNPEFGIIFRENNEIVGVNVTIPLNRTGWKLLINGELLESDCNENYIFNNETDDAIGLHVYHIRKNADIDDFYKLSLSGLNETIMALRKHNENLKVIGFSGLCVTKMGIGLFFNKLNCRESAVIKNEHIVKGNDSIEIIKMSHYRDMEKKLKAGREYMHRCKMLVLYPGDPSVVWKYIKTY